MRRRSVVAVAAVAAATVALASCTGQRRAADDASPSASLPSRAELVARAHLAPCPASVAAPATSRLPAASLPCLGDGPAVRLSGLRGAPTVVNLWGSWCDPCQTEATYLSAAYDALGTRVRFLGVAVDDDPLSALDFDAHVDPPVHYPSVVDGDKVTLPPQHAPGLPVTLFVRADGSVAHTTYGAYTSTAGVRADLARYLGVR